MGFASGFGASMKSSQCSRRATVKLLVPRPAQPWGREKLVALERDQVENDRQIVDRTQGSESWLNSPQARPISTWNQILNGPARHSSQQDQQAKNNDMF